MVEFAEYFSLPGKKYPPDRYSILQQNETSARFRKYLEDLFLLQRCRWGLSYRSISLRWNLASFKLSRMNSWIQSGWWFTKMLCFILAWLVLWWLSYLQHWREWDPGFSSGTGNGDQEWDQMGQTSSIRNVCGRKRSFYGVLPWAGGPSCNSELKKCGQPVGLREVANLNASPLWARNESRNRYRNQIDESQNIFIAGVIQLENMAGIDGPMIGLPHLPLTPSSKTRCWDGPLVEQTLSWSTANGANVSHQRPH